MSDDQLPLFPGGAGEGSYGPRVARWSELTADSSLSAAMERFHDYMVEQEYAENTVKSFMGDLRVLKRYLQVSPSGQSFEYVDRVDITLFQVAATSPHYQFALVCQTSHGGAESKAFCAEQAVTGTTHCH